MNKTPNLKDIESLVSNQTEVQPNGELPTLTPTLEIKITMSIGSKPTRNPLTIKYQLRVVEVMAISMMNAETQISMLMATYSPIHTVILAASMLATRAGAVATILTSSTPCRCAALAMVAKILLETVTEKMVMEMEMAMEMAMAMVTETYLVWMICSWLLNKLQPTQLLL